MRSSIVFSFFLFLLIVGCQQPEKDSIREFIPGTYSRQVNHEFGKGNITLDIRLLSGNSYEIIKRSNVTPIRNGEKQLPKQEEEKWTGLYDENSKVIHEQRKGRVISFVPKENKLLVGAMSYEKIK